MAFTPSHRLTLQALAMGDGLVGLDLVPETLPERVEIYAFSEAIQGRPCAVIDLLDRAPQDADPGGAPPADPDRFRRETADLLRALYPNIGCRCVSAEIRLDPAESPHGRLGRFPDSAGGNTFGEFHTGNIYTDARWTSNFKFEAHFRIEILNEPAHPQGTTEEEWEGRRSLFPYLCEEEQRINTTFTLRAGTPTEATEELEDDAGNAFPYEETREPNRFTRDGQGYRVPGRALRVVEGGALKAHEAADTIHWLDPPGANDLTTPIWRGREPSTQDSYFHSYVHGTTGRPEDNCDCYFGLRTGVLDAQGRAAASSVLSAPVCE